MRRLLRVLVLSVFALSGFAPGANASSAAVPAVGATTPAAASDALSAPLAPSETAAQGAPPETPVPEDKAGAEGDSETGEDDFDYDMEDVPAAEQVTIADPWEPFNRAVFTFNDRLYFWVLKPVAEGYSAVVPEPAKIGRAHV